MEPEILQEDAGLNSSRQREFKEVAKCKVFEFLKTNQGIKYTAGQLSSTLTMKHGKAPKRDTMLNYLKEMRDDNLISHENRGKLNVFWFPMPKNQFEDIIKSIPRIDRLNEMKTDDLLTRVAFDMGVDVQNSKFRTDFLTALKKLNYEYRENNVLCFMTFK